MVIIGDLSSQTLAKLVVSAAHLWWFTAEFSNLQNVRLNGKQTTVGWSL